jgi:AsmA protein
MKALKWLGFALAGFWALLLLAVSIAIVIVNPDDYKPRLEETARQNGVTLKIGGSLHWSLLPLGFSTTDLLLQMPQDPGKELQQIRIGRIALSLGMFSLLRGNLDIQAFDIDDLRFFTAETQTLQFREARLKVDDANNRGEQFPVELRIDDTRIAGSLAISTVNDALHMQVDLHGDQIDLDRYAPADTPDTDSQAGSKQADGQTGKKDKKQKKEEPIAFAGLLQAQGSYRIRFDQMVSNHLKLANVVFDARVEQEQVILNAFDAELYDGRISHRGTISLPPGKEPVLQLEMRIEQVQLSPMLADLTQETPSVTAGIIDLQANVRGSGATERKIMRTLSGVATLDVNNLVIRDLNIEKSACDAAAAAQKKELSTHQWPRDTALHNLHAEGDIINGIVFIKPVTARLDTLALSGSGPVNLLNETLDLKLDITVRDGVQSANHCDAISPAVRDVAWPLRCEGSYRGALDDLCGIDKSRLGKLIAQLAAKNIKEGGGSLKDTLRGLFN